MSSTIPYKLEYMKLFWQCIAQQYTAQDARDYAHHEVSKLMERDRNERAASGGLIVNDFSEQDFTDEEIERAANHYLKGDSGKQEQLALEADEVIEQVIAEEDEYEHPGNWWDELSEGKYQDDIPEQYVEGELVEMAPHDVKSVEMARVPKREPLPPYVRANKGMLIPERPAIKLSGPIPSYIAVPPKAKKRVKMEDRWRQAGMKARAANAKQASVRSMLNARGPHPKGDMWPGTVTNL